MLEYDEKVDIYSAAIVFWEMVKKKKVNKFYFLIQKIFQKKKKKVTRQYPFYHHKSIKTNSFMYQLEDVI